MSNQFSWNTPFQKDETDWFSNTSGPSAFQYDNAPPVDPVSFFEKEASDIIPDFTSSLPSEAQSLVKQVFSGFGGTGNDLSVGTRDSSPLGIGAQVQDNKSLIDKVSDKIDGASDWLEKHKKLTELVTGAIGNAYVADEKRKAAEALQQSRLNEQNNAARIAQEQNAAFSASISGLRPRKKGLINQTPLKRLDGSRVFDNTGKVA